MFSFIFLTEKDWTKPTLIFYLFDGKKGNGPPLISKKSQKRMDDKDQFLYRLKILFTTAIEEIVDVICVELLSL